MTVVLDSQALVLLAAHDRTLQHIIAAAVAERARVVVPAVVLAETMTGKLSDAAMWHLLNRLAVLDVTARIAARAGAMRERGAKTRAKKRDLTVDAIVAACAQTVAPSTIITTDPSDLAMLVDTKHVQVVSCSG